MCREPTKDRHLSHPHRFGLALLLITVAATLAAGCSNRSPDRRLPLATADTLANGIPRAFVTALSPWTAMWQSAMPGFSADSLTRAGRGPALRGGYVQAAKNVFPYASPEDEAAFDVLSAASPNGRYKLVFDWYQAIDEDEGSVNIGGEPDSAPLLIDLRLGLSNQFESCGTSCGYHWGCWIDSTRFALAGWAEVDVRGDTLCGVLGIYSLADSSEVRYVTRLVRRDTYDKYSAAWHEWVRGRYRIWKNSRPRA